jgi:triosephosphate isomerase
MRKKIVAGNWKMNNDHQQGLELVTEIKTMLADEVHSNTTVVVAPSFIHLGAVGKLINGASNLHLGAQNCSQEDKGAFTGEVSVEMLKSVGVAYVIIGHSERRAYFHESNEMLAMKVDKALSKNLTPVFCCGEVLEERNAGKHFEVVTDQISKALFHLEASKMAQVVIAYEPVWAIGTGVTASTEQAQEMHAFIRGVVTKKYGQTTADGISILYGGSCNPKNAKELFAQPDVDGGLIGGASLKSRDFIDIVKAMTN